MQLGDRGAPKWVHILTIGCRCRPKLHRRRLHRAAHCSGRDTHRRLTSLARPARFLHRTGLCRRSCRADLGCRLVRGRVEHVLVGRPAPGARLVRGCGHLEPPVRGPSLGRHAAHELPHRRRSRYRSRYLLASSIVFIRRPNLPKCSVGSERHHERGRSRRDEPSDPRH